MTMIETMNVPSAVPKNVDAVLPAEQRRERLDELDLEDAP